MKKTGITILLIISFLWAAPNASAFFRDKATEATETNGSFSYEDNKATDQNSEMSNSMQEMIHKKAYQDMLAEKKRLSKEAIPRRDKRKATLTPFVYDTPQEMEALAQRKNASKKNDLSNKDLSKGSSLTIMKTDAGKEISESILINFIVVAVCITAMIFFPLYLRRKR